MACIGEPISWLRLEAFALGATDPAIPLHTAACSVCRHCLDQIRGDAVALPPLELPTQQQPARPWWRAPRRWWRAPRWWHARRGSRARRSADPARLRRWPAIAFAGAAVVAIAVIAIVIIAPGESSPPGAAPLGVVAVKGVGDVRLELVRERAGEIRRDASTFARGDRWKVIVTCAPSASTWVEVSVSDGATSDHPIAPAQLVCGNGVVVPGAFTLTGIGANRVCVRVAVVRGAPAATACTTVRPE